MCALAAFDVVLMDAQMPTMNGLEAATAIRHLPDKARACVPIIAITAHAMREDRQRCLDAGMDDYLSKPVDVAALVSRVEFYGSQSRRGTVLEEQPSTPAADKDKRDFIAGALFRLGGDEELLKELIRLFRQDAQSLREKIHSGLAAGDAESTARAAHNIKGLAANFDATAVVEAANDIERQAVQSDLVAAEKLVPTLESELARLLSVLESYQADAT